MQFFWVSGPVGNIKRVNLSKTNLVLIAISTTCALVLMGIGLQFLGFRIAIEYNPTLARKLGNVHTSAELEKLNSLYKSRLITIEDKLEENNKKIENLVLVNAKLRDFATPPTLVSEKVKNVASGGPFIPVKQQHPSDANVFTYLESVHKSNELQEQFLGRSVDYWNKELAWLNSMPISYPIEHRVSISSLFGHRIDPIKGVLGDHQGLDFQNSIGTPIKSSGNGIVEKAGGDPQYGNEVIINHGDGYKTRYAHANELLVKQGEYVSRSQLIAKVGQSGRATGPHLHYEILKNGRPVDPQAYLIGSRKLEKVN